ncbi:MAG TPA: DUF2304 domain-containing protein [Ilumatobacteraceae bacterium]
MSTRAYLVFAVATIAVLAVIIRMVRMRRLRAKYALMWLATGLVVAPIALVPGFLDWIASLFGVAYGPALLLVLGLGFLGLLSVHFSSELTRLEERTRVLAEETALLREKVREGAAGNAGSGDETTGPADAEPS